MSEKLQVPINVVNEQKNLSYLLHYPEQVSKYDSKLFLDKQSKIIFQSMQDAGKEFDLDLVQVRIVDKNPDFDISIVQKIYNAYGDFEQIEEHKKILLNDYLKRIVSKQVMEEVLTRATQNDYLDEKDLKKTLQSLVKQIENLEGNSVNFQRPDQMIPRHRKVIEERRLGKNKRTLGFRDLDQFITKPAAAGQITLAFSPTGVGKSIFAKNVSNKLINQGVCVLEISTEMLEPDDIDRYLCIRENLKLADIVSSDSSPRLKGKIDKALREFEGIKNYAYYSNEDEGISIDSFDALLYEEKEKFKKLGVLPEDGYMFIICDLISDFEDFTEESREQITVGMKKFHKVIKRHKVHALIIVQANENKFRNGQMFKKPEDLDFYKPGLEDIYGGSGYSKKCRVVFSLMRPLLFKRRFFPELNEIWDDEMDIMKIHCVKQNEGELFMREFMFSNSFKITPFKRNGSSE